jgi:hypothetical protein
MSILKLKLWGSSLIKVRKKRLLRNKGTKSTFVQFGTFTEQTHRAVYLRQFQSESPILR